MTAHAESGHATQSDALSIEPATQMLIIALAKSTRLSSSEPPAARHRAEDAHAATSPNRTRQAPGAHLPRPGTTPTRARGHRVRPVSARSSLS